MEVETFYINYKNKIKGKLNKKKDMSLTYILLLLSLN